MLSLEVFKFLSFKVSVTWKVLQRSSDKDQDKNTKVIYGKEKFCRTCNI